MSLSLTPEKKALITKMLKDKTAYEVGLAFELDKHYKNAATMIATVSKIYNQVKNNPEKYAMDPMIIKEVEAKVNSRRAVSVRGEEGVAERKTLRQITDEKKNMKIEDIALDNRAKAAALLSIRLDDYLNSKKHRSKIGLGELAKVYGITFDKGQIVEGKATDHVAMMAKIDGDMTPGEAIDVVMKMREYNNAVAEQASKKK